MKCGLDTSTPVNDGGLSRSQETDGVAAFDCRGEGLGELRGTDQFDMRFTASNLEGPDQQPCAPDALSKMQEQARNLQSKQPNPASLEESYLSWSLKLNRRLLFIPEAHAYRQ
jgi:hypothetical protein